MPLTDNFAWIEPTVAGDNNAWGQKLNDMFAQIDTDLKAAKDTADAATPNALPLAGGTMTGDIHMDGHSADKVSQLGRSVEDLALSGGGNDTWVVDTNHGDCFADVVSSNKTPFILAFTNVAPALGTYREVKVALNLTGVGSQSLVYTINGGSQVTLLASATGPHKLLVTLVMLQIASGTITLATLQTLV
jgi:hypothetical protein